MSKALIGLLALGGLGALAYYGTKKDGSVSGPPTTVQGGSGIIYTVQLINSFPTPGGNQITFDVSDSQGHILQYSQIQGRNETRTLVQNSISTDVAAVTQAVQDFGINS